MKNYVKEHKGRKVPEGAVYYGDGNQCFYNANKSEFHSSVYSKWKPISCTVTARMAVELPEASQEWNGEGLPPVGTVCEATDYWNAPERPANLVDGQNVSIIMDYLCPVTKTQGVIFTWIEGYDNIRTEWTGNEKHFRPIKTQQEKDREAFVECVKQLLPKSDTDDLILSGKLFDLGFTAPKEGDNDK